MCRPGQNELGEKAPQESNEEDYEDRGEVEPSVLKGQPSPDRVKDRLRGRDKETDGRVIGIEVDPGDNHPGDDQPHIDPESKIQELEDADQKVVCKRHGPS
jgi:hypothetical protein